jgi:hypothetical protein
MALRKLLDAARKPLVNFNPNYSEHRKAYVMLEYTGKQHPHLRFLLEENFEDVLTMMRVKIAALEVDKEIQEVNKEQRPNVRDFKPVLWRDLKKR